MNARRPANGLMGLRALSYFFAWYAITGGVAALAAVQTAPAIAGALALLALASGAASMSLKRRRAWAATALPLTALAGLGLCLAVLTFVDESQRSQASGPILLGAALWTAFCAVVARYARGQTSMDRS